MDAAYVVESEVVLPLPMWLAGREVRIVGWRLGLVLGCGAPARDVACTIEAASLSADPYGSDHGALEGEVLPESNAALTGATVHLRFDRTGGLAAVGLDGPPSGTPRDAAIAENLRLIVARAVAGFDLPRPVDGVDEWRVRRSALFALPDLRSVGGARVTHRREEVDGAARVASSGRSTVLLVFDHPTTSHAYAAQLESEATVDGDALLGRSWTVSARASAHTTPSLPYLQRGTLARLGEGETVVLGPPGRVALADAPRGLVLGPGGALPFLGEDPGEPTAVREGEQGRFPWEPRTRPPLEPKYPYPVPDTPDAPGGGPE